ncbi:hypothetical protein ABNQ39_17275 [Azospirillum sp. A26]|uniref:hypothetical protein n=1 Tax=Azospirillum sp. A26 TaxID=3160607 RepID=UPI00366F71B0
MPGALCQDARAASVRPEDRLHTRRLFPIVLFSCAVLLSGASIAATDDGAAPGSFAIRPVEAKLILRNDHTRIFARYQRTEIERYLKQADALPNPGS